MTTRLPSVVSWNPGRTKNYKPAYIFNYNYLLLISRIYFVPTAIIVNTVETSCKLKIKSEIIFSSHNSECLTTKSNSKINMSKYPKVCN